MNRPFNLNFDRMRDNDPGKPDNTASVENYDQTSHVRKVTFVQLDGQRASIGYEFLIWNKYFPDTNQIVLTFTGGTVTLTGINLAKLQDDFDQHMPRKVICMDERYNNLDKTGAPIVNRIEIL